jgi:T5SS/PEP-CTERM-associated repeat protein
MQPSHITHATIVARSRTILHAFLAFLCIANPFSIARAAITAVGNVSPNPPNGTDIRVGYLGGTSSGTLTVDSGSALASNFVYVGFDTGETGVVGVDGPGSIWTITSGLDIGISGNGTMNITNGGTVCATSNIYGSLVGYFSGSTGSVTVAGTGSQWSNARSICLSGGTMNINSGGAVNSVGLSTIRGSITLDGASQTNVKGAVAVDGSGSSWNNAGGINVDNGTLNVANGGSVINPVGNAGSIVGVAYGSATATIDGVGSNWTNNSGICVAWASDGTLNIVNGGSVRCVGCAIGINAGATGLVTVDGPGSSLEILENGALSVGEQGDGTLKISGGASVSGGWGSIVGRTGNVTVSGIGSSWRSSSLYVSGILNITRGATVVGDNWAVIDDKSASGALVTVNGIGSSWSLGSLSVAPTGHGTLRITCGAIVNSGQGTLGDSSGSTGAVVVDGAGSAWTCSSSLQIAGQYNCQGTLRVNGGGNVAAGSVWIGNGQSLLAIDVGRGSSLTVGGGMGTITNDGTIRFLAGAGVPVGVTYSPISAKTWINGGNYQAIGGTLNTSDCQFTASPVHLDASGSPAEIDLSSVQRVLVSDTSTRWSLGASFLAKPTITPLTFIASTISDGGRTSLVELLEPDQSVLGAWIFTTSGGYTAGDPAYLSFGIGSGYSPDDLEVWHYDGTNWTPFSADDLTYDGNYASFTANDLIGYAVTGMAAVPEPSTIVFVGAGALGLLGYVWRRRKARA